MIVVVGAGAAGLMAAIFAARGGGRVRLIERTAEGGKKILISGGGRCNILPSALAAERFVTDSAPHVMRRMLRAWPLHEQRAFFEHDLKVPLALEAETGKLFPASNRARDVRDALVDHARNLGVTMGFGVALTGLTPAAGGWAVETTHGVERAERVVLATGGLSVPATGSDGTGLRLAAALGLRLHPTYPALTPLTSGPEGHAALSGISLRVRARARSTTRDAESAGGFLFTHRGYSGPSILDVSHVAARDRSASVRIQWGEMSESMWAEHLATSVANAANALAAFLPQRLAERLVAEAGIPPDRRATQLRRHERIRLLELLTAYPLPWTGDEGFKKAEVTGGGIALEEFDPRTLESRAHPGLFICGETLDAFGPIGGHNFAWAWATGRAAGTGAALRSPLTVSR